MRTSEDNESDQNFLLQTNPYSVPLDLYPATPDRRFLHDCLHVAARFGVIAFLDSPALSDRPQTTRNGLVPT